jgi:hypothetical protein
LFAQFINSKHLEKDFGGTSNWSYRFEEPIAGENKKMEDLETRTKRMNQFVDIAEKLEELTKKWIDGDSSAGQERRDVVLKELDIRRLDLDPYIRGRTSFDKNGTVSGDGQVTWRYDRGRKEQFGVSADTWAKELNIEDPSERPRNLFDDPDEIALDSAEDTVSSTDPSDEDPLDDPHHHHHSAAKVGLAKFGDGIANSFSHMTPGPSIHEKKRIMRAKKHEEHERRRQKKLELKRAQLEKKRKEEEERAMTEQEEEEAINSSYTSYLASFGNLTLAAGNKAADYVPAGEFALSLFLTIFQSVRWTL